MIACYCWCSSYQMAKNQKAMFIKTRVVNPSPEFRETTLSFAETELRTEMVDSMVFQDWIFGCSISNLEFKSVDIGDGEQYVVYCTECQRGNYRTKIDVQCYFCGTPISREDPDYINSELWNMSH